MKLFRSKLFYAAALPIALAGCAAGNTAPPAVAPDPVGSMPYVAWVASESADEVSRVAFGPGGAAVHERQQVGTMPADLDGPHGIALSPDGRFYYVSIAHGKPFGTLFKVDVRTGRSLGAATLGLFPATVDVTPDGRFAFVSNFNLHGDHVASSVSKVSLANMEEVARTETCVMPHGSRVNPQGTKQYSVCMMNDLLVEIDVATGAVSQRFSVAPGREGLVREAHADHGMVPAAAACLPTWAHPGASGARVYVACNKANVVLEIDTRTWTVARRFPTGPNPYNLAVTPDGRYVLATLKNRTAPATEVIDLATGQTAARIPSTTVLPHGVDVTADSRYAVVSVEGVGAEPGKVDVIDLSRLERVASVPVGQQAGGIVVARQ